MTHGVILEFPIMGILVKVFFIKEKNSTQYIHLHIEINNKHKVSRERQAYNMSCMSRIQDLFI